MRQYPVLKTIVKKNLPELEAMNSKKKKKLLKEFLSENLIDILLKVKLPDPYSFKMRMMKEHYLDQRRPKGHKRGQKNFNYNLWRKLYEAKFKLNFNILQNSQVEYEHVFGNTISTIPKLGNPNTTIWEMPEISSASSVLADIDQIASNVQINQELQAKMVVNSTYKEFVHCINDACKSYQVKQLGTAEYYIHEKTDIENPKWHKIILDARFYERDLEKKMETWEKLREIIDEYIGQLKQDIETSEEIKKLEQKFYINLVY